MKKRYCGRALRVRYIFAGQFFASPGVIYSLLLRVPHKAKTGISAPAMPAPVLHPLLPPPVGVGSFGGYSTGFPLNVPLPVIPPALLKILPLLFIVPSLSIVPLFVSVLPSGTVNVAPFGMVSVLSAGIVTSSVRVTLLP